MSASGESGRRMQPASGVCLALILRRLSISHFAYSLLLQRPPSPTSYRTPSIDGSSQALSQTTTRTSILRRLVGESRATVSIIVQLQSLT